MFPIRDTLKSRHIPWMTWLLIAVNVLVFFMELATPRALVEQQFYLFGIFSGTLWLASPSEVSGIAWWAHIGGFATGILTFWLFLRPRRALPAGFG